MSDDDLIRDAVHELVAAAPSPKPLPMGGASSGGPYRWLAVAAAVILVIGGIVAIAWSQADDDATPVATTRRRRCPTPPPDNGRHEHAGADEPGHGPRSPIDGPVTRREHVTNHDVDDDEHDHQYDDHDDVTADAGTGPVAGVPRRRSPRAATTTPLCCSTRAASSPSGRADLRPLFTEYGDIDDLPARLQSWCENEAICTQPDTAPVDIGGYWMATWTTPGGAVTGYFRSGSFEGSPSVGGLPPRRPSGAVVACPTRDVIAVREADLDGDGAPETIVVTLDAAGTQRHVYVCNTRLGIPPLDLPADAGLVIGVLQPTSEPSATLLIGEAGEGSSCGATYRLAASAGALVQVGWERLLGSTPASRSGAATSRGVVDRHVPVLLRRRRPARQQHGDRTSTS